MSPLKEKSTTLLQSQSSLSISFQLVKFRKSKLIRNPSLKNGSQNGTPQKRHPSKDEDLEQDESFYMSQQPSILQNGLLRPHQLVGLNWLISMSKIGFNGILADEMGLGKTIQAIAFFGYLIQYEGIKGPFLVVCPNTVVSNWKKELKKWLPDLRVVKLIARKEHRFEIIDRYIKTLNFDVIVTSYEGINICLKDLKRVQWKYLIVDEAHRIKNDQSLLSQNLRGLKTDLKLLITGTPLQNNLKELWALLNFIMPELFDDSSIFEEFGNKSEEVSPDQVEQKNIQLITSLHKILRPFILKRTKAVIDLTIPPKKEIHLYVGLTKVQTDIYRNLLLKKYPTDQSTKSSLLNVLMQLRKACNHPYLFPGVEDETLPSQGDHLFQTSGKMLVLDKILEKLIGHQVLIFSQFTSMLDILEDYLLYKNYKYCRIDGTTFLEDREIQIEEFSKPQSDKFVFLLSTRAGGLGINLTSADTVILYDSDWNPQVDLQAMDRAHRIGQTKNVNVYRFITENTIEEKMIERQSIKLKWDQLVILKGKITQKQKMNKDELKDLIQFGSKIIFKSDNGTIKEQDLDQLLERGEQRLKEMEQKIDSFLKQNDEKLFELGINSINVYEFEGADYNEKRKEDQEIIHQKLSEEYEKKKLAKRIGITGQLQEEQKNIPPKKIELPEYHFYPNKKELEEILNKEQNKIELTEIEQKNKEDWKKKGFTGFNKNDYFAIIRSLEKYEQTDIKQIANYVKKEEQEVKKYLTKMMKLIDELSEGERIKKNIERYYKNVQCKEKSSKILASKCAGIERYSDLQLDHQLYNKVRSKFYTNFQDKFLIYQAYLHGESNYKLIKKNLISERIFRYDFYLRGLKDSLLKKRIQSLIKMLENEQDSKNKKKDKKEEKGMEIEESELDDEELDCPSENDSSDEEPKKKTVQRKKKVEKIKKKIGKGSKKQPEQGKIENFYKKKQKNTGQLN